MTFPPEIYLVSVNGTIHACRDEEEVHRLVKDWAEYSVMRVDLGRGSRCPVCGLTLADPPNPPYRAEVIDNAVMAMAGGVRL